MKWFIVGGKLGLMVVLGVLKLLCLSMCVVCGGLCCWRINDVGRLGCCFLCFVSFVYVVVSFLFIVVEVVVDEFVVRLMWKCFSM